MMTAGVQELPTADLEQRLRAVCPSVRLVKDRQFRLILSRLVDQGELVATSVEAPLWIRRSSLDELQILPKEPIANAPELTLLIHAPDDWLDPGLPLPQVLRFYWRVIFRARLQQLLQEHHWHPIQQPSFAWREAWYVLEEDGLIPQNCLDSTFFATFGSLFGDLYEFEPDQLACYFPSLMPLRQAIRNELGQVVDLDQLRQSTRPEGAADAQLRVEQDWTAEVESESPDGSADVQASQVTQLLEEAKKRGNWVRVAILEQRRSRPSSDPAQHCKAARQALEKGLIPNLAPLCQWDPDRQEVWVEGLVTLLEPASRGVWPQAARCLFDLQKIVTDLGGEIFMVEPIEWVRSFGKRPVVRTLTRARIVILQNHWRIAYGHLKRSQLDPEVRQQLDRLFTYELQQCERRLREELSPVIRSVLQEVGLSPQSPIEAVALDKVIAELLDYVCTKGYLRMSDLRDTIARNQLKLSNLSGPIQLFRGDPLLLADERLALELDGVYHRGEAYLRGLQRLTAISFGTSVGSWLSRFVALPFGGAFMAVEFSKYLSYEAAKVSGFVLRQFGLRPVTVEDQLGSIGGSAVSAAHYASQHNVSPFSSGALVLVFALGLLILLLIHVPTVRLLAIELLSASWRVLRLGLVELPRMIWRSPLFRFIRHNTISRTYMRYCGTATWVSFLVAMALTLNPGDPMVTARVCTAIFISITLFCATRLGRSLEDSLADWLAALWRDLSVNLIQGVIRWVLWVFHLLGNFIERWLYTVDEWLRFREGQSRSSLWLKGVLSVLWFPIAYLFRFSFYLLIEPQVNPVKHFPVVTVGHKLILPLTPEVGALIGSNWLAGAIVSGIPGIFGFIAWELKENWRLYAANRTVQLPHAALGHHGESMRGLLRRGFHSGTVPRLYSMLRKLFHKADRSGQPQPLAKATNGLHDIAHVLELFIQREWLMTMRLSPEMASVPLNLGPVQISVQSISLELQHGTHPDARFRILFEHIDSAIVAIVPEKSLLELLTTKQRRPFLMAVAGICQMCCSELPKGLAEIEPITWPRWQTYWADPT